MPCTTGSAQKHRASHIMIIAMCKVLPSFPTRGKGFLISKSLLVMIVALVVKKTTFLNQFCRAFVIPSTVATTSSYHFTTGAQVKKGEFVAPKFSTGSTLVHKSNVNMSLLDNNELLDKEKEFERLLFNGSLDDVRDFIKINGFEASVILEQFDISGLPNFAGRRGGRLLQMAAAGGQLNIAQFLAEECRVDVDFIYDGKSAFFCAIEAGHYEIVQYFINDCHCNVDIVGRHERTALHFYCNHSILRVLDKVKYLVEECGANVNSKDRFGQTVIHLAASSGCLDTVQYLAEHGANLEAKDNDGCTALHMSYRSLNVIEFFTRQSSIDVNAQNEIGLTVLHKACAFGCLDVVQHLVQKCHANVEAKCRNGRTPLLHAVEWDDKKYFHTFDVVRFLVQEALVNVEAKDDQGDTAFILACKNDNLDVIRFLMQECYANGSKLL